MRHNIYGGETQQLLYAHWRDLSRCSRRDNRPRFTAFLPAEDERAAGDFAAKEGVLCTAWGGTEHTARVMLCFSVILPAPEQFPLCCLTLRYHSARPPEHRDFLGSLMACNIERETIGDILISSEMAQIFVCRHIAPVVIQELRQVGGTGVTVSEDEPVCLSAQTAFKTLTGTVASLRADAIAAFVTRLSREKAAQLIRQGRLTRFHTTVETPSASMQTGDVFSIRGYGKFRLEEIGGITRKGRYHIIIYQYQ